MNAKTFLSMVMLAAVLLFFSGCGNSSNGSVQRSNPYISGTEGLSVSFEPNSIPNPALDNGQSSFSLAVHLINKGSFTIPAGKVKVSLSGFNPAVFGVSADDIVKRTDSDLEGVTKLSGKSTSPGQTIITFPAFSYKSKLLSDSITLNLVANVCYLYQTDALGYLCVKANPYSTDNTVCSVSGQKTIYSSAAPIQVSELTENLAGNSKLKFVFNIEQKGNGLVFSPDSDCSVNSTNMYAVENKVFVTIKTAPSLNGKITCNGLADQKSGNGIVTGYATLYNKQAVISCIEDLDEVSTDFEPTLHIIISYDYDTTITAPLVVQKSE